MPVKFTLQLPEFFVEKKIFFISTPQYRCRFRGKREERYPAKSSLQYSWRLLKIAKYNSIAQRESPFKFAIMSMKL